jgi:tetratricopeptide (TPR) repeat protein
VVADPFFRAPRALVAALRDSVSVAYRTTPYPDVVERSDSVSTSDVRSYLIGLLDVRLGDVAAARTHLTALRSVNSPQRAELDSALAIGLEAEILRSQGNAKAALAALDRFPSRHYLFRSFPHATTHDRFLRAELLHSLGRDREALAWYESLATMYDLPYLAPAHFRCAEIYERLGERDAAAFHYSRFARMWAHASPELQPLVQRARQAIAR